MSITLKLTGQVNPDQSVMHWFRLDKELDMVIPYFLAAEAKKSNFLTFRQHVINAIGNDGVHVQIDVQGNPYVIYQQNGGWNIGINGFNMAQMDGLVERRIKSFFELQLAEMSLASL